MLKKQISHRVIILIISLFLLLPLFLTFMYSSFSNWTGILPNGFTLRYYVELFNDQIFQAALGRSLFISIFPVFICVLCMVLVLYVTTIYYPRLDKFIETLCTIPYAIQGVILAIGILSLYSGAPGFLSDRMFLLVGAYCIIILPYIYRGLKNAINSVNVKCLLDAAQMLGCGKFRAFMKIILPNIFSGICIASMLSISIIFADFVIVNIIGGSYYQTASIYLYQKMQQSGQITSAIIVVLFITTLCMSSIVLFLENRLGKRKERT